MPRVVLEAVVQSPDDARAAEAAGADRLELCVEIEVGGVTPPRGLVEAVLAATSLPVAVMLRPHGRDFRADADDRATIRRDLARLARLPVEAVVFGALTDAGDPDLDLLAEVRDGGKPVVFHRAVDHARDPDAAYAAVLAAGVARVLTGGGPGPATANLAALRARRGPALLPGGGIRAATVAAVLDAADPFAVHAGPFAHGRLDDGEIRELRAALDRRAAVRPEVP